MRQLGALVIGVAAMSLAACSSQHGPDSRGGATRVETNPRPLALVMSAPSWDEALLSYRCVAAGCSVRFGATLTTDVPMEPTLRLTVVNMDVGEEDSLELPLSVFGQRSIQFTGLPAGEYESYATVVERDSAELTRLGASELRLYVEPRWAQGQ